MTWPSIEKKWKRKLLQRRKSHKENTNSERKSNANIVRGMDNKPEGVITLESQYNLKNKVSSIK